ncbi:carbamoyltransferase N-terminal domain-containing protein [Nocardia arthritidis]|uniref:Carbamoyltransferase domain-containing protein n=1 Tax=Nocardia arthritidis TaxID=228602 RepID=A0A6G9YHM0_9NOCA|nr:carbamoyltransferase N-terminal domain-containing protein [Nocardia arthritidis]QIS12698.1 hypothetical protein F5544_24205 [Nocardia arthritidis]
MITLGYNGFASGAKCFGEHYGAVGVARNLLAGHDASAALVIDGELVAAVEEERLSRVTTTSDIPKNAIDWCLEFAGIEFDCGVYRTRKSVGVLQPRRKLVP